jgi:hypothetical protein
MPPVAERTEHFRYRVDEGLPLCPEALQWMESHYAEVSAWLGVRLPQGERFDYSFVHQEDLEAFCGGPASGCATETYAFANRPFHGHELVHLYANLLGRPPAFFREGIAEVLGAGWTDDTRPMERGGLVLDLLDEAAFQAHPDMRQAYDLAAGFVSFLIARYGRQAFLDFYASVPSRASREAIGQDFEAFFGDTPELAVERWQRAPAQYRADVALHLTECAAPSVQALEADPLSLTCGLDPDEGVRVLVRSLHVPSNAHLPDILLDTHEAVQVDVFSCRTGRRAASAHIPAGAPFSAHLAPGHYWVRISG